MIVQTIKTRKVTPKACTLFELLDESLTVLKERSVVAIASKIVSLCEGSVVPLDQADKDQLIEQYATYYLPRSFSRYQVSFTITNGWLVPGAGIDESNGSGHYILWPKDIQKTANDVRQYLRKKHGLTEVGVILTDSTTRPLMWGTTGIALAYSGFAPLKDYIGTPDLFGREFQFHKNNIANGLAAAAVVVMGEGAEQTPIAVVNDLPFVQFQDHDPTQEELTSLRIALEDDVYAPLIQTAPWQKGDGPPETTPA